MDVLMLICGLLCGFFIYRQGVKDGMRAKEGIIPKLPDPVTYVQKVKEEKETKKHDDALMTEFENIMSYTGDKQFGGEEIG